MCSCARDGNRQETGSRGAVSIQLKTSQTWLRLEKILQYPLVVKVGQWPLELGLRGGLVEHLRLKSSKIREVIGVVFISAYSQELL